MTSVTSGAPLILIMGILMTAGGNTSKYCIIRGIGMANRTAHIVIAACYRKKRGMIKGRRGPVGGGMTGFTGRWEICPLVVRIGGLVVFSRMATITACWGAS